MNARSEDPPVSEVARGYLDAIVSGDRNRAFHVVDHARGAGLDIVTLYMQVFQPALREIGRLWHENRITVADEHLATAITESAMARVFGDSFNWRSDSSPKPRTVIAACADIERHEVGLRMLIDLLDLSGWETTYLGATVPGDSLVAMVYRRRPTVVALSAAIAPHIARIREMISDVRSRVEDPPFIIVGGRAFDHDPDLAFRVGADATAPTAEAGVAELERRFPAAASDAAS